MTLRYSEDTDRKEEDRVAVLEYELRTAREALQQLKSEVGLHGKKTAGDFKLNQVASLTADERQRHVSESRGGGEGDMEEVDTAYYFATFNKTSSTRSSLHKHVQISQKCCQVDILPHEQKLLNWCVHDYLVRQGFRISAITFSDECSEQVG